MTPIKFHTRVVQVERRSRILRGRKVGDDVVIDQEDLGWFMLLEGSNEAIKIGDGETHDVVVGEEVEVIIRGRQR